jgi:hypothetical protein
MQDLQPEKRHTIVREILKDDSVIAIDRGDSSISTSRDADKYIHYELVDESRHVMPVEYSDVEMIPLTSDSVVIVVWLEDGNKYERYYEPNRFQDKFL